MNRSLRSLFGSAAVAAWAMVLGHSSSASAVTTVQAYNSVGINSETSVHDAEGSANDSLLDTTGAPVTLSVSSSSVAGNVGGYVTYAFGHYDGSGLYTFKPVLDNVYASASLTDGILKAGSETAFGTDQAPYNTPVPQNATNSSAAASASYADSFSTVNSSDGSPFVWSSGDTGTFNLQVTGTQTVKVNDARPRLRIWEAADSHNQIYATLTIDLFKPGTLELIQELDNTDYATDPDLYNTLNDEINANFISYDYEYLGVPLTSYTVDPTHVTELNPTGPTDVSFTVDPGQADFEWIVGLSETIQLDASQQNVDVTEDFSHTVIGTYTGPTGTTTLGAVQFNNVAAAAAPGAIPEPVTTMLLAMGLGAIGATALRRRGARTVA